MSIMDEFFEEETLEDTPQETVPMTQLEYLETMVSLSKRLDTTEKKLEGMRNELSGIRNGINSLNSFAYKNLQSLNERVNELEECVANILVKQIEVSKISRWTTEPAEVDEFKMWVKSKNKERAAEED